MTSATILKFPPTAPRAVTGAESIEHWIDTHFLSEKLCQDIEYGIAHCLTELFTEQLEAHCIRAKQLIDLAAWDRAYSEAYPGDYGHLGGDAA